jgi:hypothetical protein
VRASDARPAAPSHASRDLSVIGKPTICIGIRNKIVAYCIVVVVVSGDDDQMATVMMVAVTRSQG